MGETHQLVQCAGRVERDLGNNDSDVQAGEQITIWPGQGSVVVDHGAVLARMPVAPRSPRSVNQELQIDIAGGFPVAHARVGRVASVDRPEKTAVLGHVVLPFRRRTATPVDFVDLARVARSLSHRRRHSRHEEEQKSQRSPGMRSRPHQPQTNGHLAESLPLLPGVGASAKMASFRVFGRVIFWTHFLPVWQRELWRELWRASHGRSARAGKSRRRGWCFGRPAKSR